MKTTLRIAWDRPYCYLEFEYEKGEPVDYADLAEQTLQAEAAWNVVREVQPRLAQTVVPPPQYAGDPGPQEEAPPAARPTQRQQSSPPSGTNGGSGVAFCPEHNNAPCLFSAPKYNRDGDRMYHALPESDWYEGERGLVKNHSLYWRQTVDARGESNQGKPLPQPVSAR